MASVVRGSDLAKDQAHLLLPVLCLSWPLIIANDPQLR